MEACRLEAQLQTKLHDSHRITQTSNLAHTSTVRRKLIDVREADTSWIAEERRVCGVQRLHAKLNIELLPEREVLKEREIQIALAGPAHDVVAERAKPAKILPVGSVAGHARKRLRVIPLCPRW